MTLKVQKNRQVAQRNGPAHPVKFRLVRTAFPFPWDLHVPLAGQTDDDGGCPGRLAIARAGFEVRPPLCDSFKSDGRKMRPTSSVVGDVGRLERMGRLVGGRSVGEVLVSNAVAEGVEVLTH